MSPMLNKFWSAHRSRYVAFVSASKQFYKKVIAYLSSKIERKFLAVIIFCLIAVATFSLSLQISLALFLQIESFVFAAGAAVASLLKMKPTEDDGRLSPAIKFGVFCLIGLVLTSSGARKFEQDSANERNRKSQQSAAALIEAATNSLLSLQNQSLQIASLLTQADEQNRLAQRSLRTVERMLTRFDKLSMVGTFTLPADWTPTSSQFESAITEFASAHPGAWKPWPQPLPQVLRWKRPTKSLISRPLSKLYFGTNLIEGFRLPTSGVEELGSIFGDYPVRNTRFACVTRPQIEIHLYTPGAAPLKDPPQFTATSTGLLSTELWYDISNSKMTVIWTADFPKELWKQTTKARSLPELDGMRFVVSLQAACKDWIQSVEPQSLILAFDDRIIRLERFERYATSVERGFAEVVNWAILAPLYSPITLDAPTVQNWSNRVVFSAMIPGEYRSPEGSSIGPPIITTLDDRTVAVTNARRSTTISDVTRPEPK